MHILISFAFLAIAVYYGVTMFMDYKSATGTTKERLLAAGKDSATKLWAKFVALISTIAGGLIGVADFFNEPAVGDAVRAYMKPEYVAGAFLVISILTELARNRTLDK